MHACIGCLACWRLMILASTTRSSYTQVSARLVMHLPICLLCQIHQHSDPLWCLQWQQNSLACSSFRCWAAQRLRSWRPGQMASPLRCSSTSPPTSPAATSIRCGQEAAGHGPFLSTACNLVSTLSSKSVCKLGCLECCMQAVTMATLITGHITIIKAFLYILAQIVGAIVGHLLQVGIVKNN